MARLTRNEIRRIRYHAYREAGFSPEEARKYRGRALDVENINLRPDGKPRINSKRFKEVVRKIEDNYSVDLRVKEWRTLENDTLYTDWGMITHDDRYKDDTSRTIKNLQERFEISHDQAYYLTYWMFINNKTLEEAQRELMTTEEFEIYPIGIKRMIEEDEEIR